MRQFAWNARPTKKAQEYDEFACFSNGLFLSEALPTHEGRAK
jgi:hypothetical protein